MSLTEGLRRIIRNNFGLMIHRERKDGSISALISEMFGLWSRRTPLSSDARLKRTDELAEKVALFSYTERILQNLQIDCVIDVGANEGQFALSLRELGYKGRIYSFEPVPSIYAILVSNSAGDPNWEVLNFGLSSLNQEKEFYIYKDTSLSSISEINAVGRDVAGKLSELVGKERVLLRTLDNWLTELNSFEAIFLKTDTQGHDLEVLRGGFEVLKRTAVALIEAPVQKIYTASFDPSEAAALMAEAALFPSRAFPISVDDNFCVIELDQFFIRREP